MRRYLLGLVLLGITSIGYADYNWASWYNQNPTIQNNLTVQQNLLTKYLNVSASGTIVGNLKVGGFTSQGAVTAGSGITGKSLNVSTVTAFAAGYGLSFSTDQNNEMTSIRIMPNTGIVGFGYTDTATGSSKVTIEPGTGNILSSATITATTVNATNGNFTNLVFTSTQDVNYVNLGVSETLTAKNGLFTSSSVSKGITTTLITAGVSNREAFAKYMGTDSGDSVGGISNGTSTDTLLYPTLFGYTVSAPTLGAVQLRAMCSAADDTSDSAAMGMLDILVARTDSATSPMDGTLSNIVGKKIFSVRNNATYHIRDYVNQTIGIGANNSITLEGATGNIISSNNYVGNGNITTAQTLTAKHLVVTSSATCTDIFISSRPCGKMAYDLNGSSLTSITTNMQYELVCGTAVLYTDTNAWFKTTNDANGNPNRLTCVAANTHKYYINAELSFDCSAATKLYMAIFKNGTIINSSRNHIAVTATSTETEPVCSTIITLGTNDYVDIRITTDDSDDASVHLGSLIAFPID